MIWALIRLIFLKLLIEDKDIIGAQAPTKQYPLAYNAESNHLQETDTAAEVHYVGTGMMCIKREVLEHMKMHYLHDLAFRNARWFLQRTEIHVVC